MKYQMPQQHLNEILHYIIMQPYKDVHHLVEYLKQAENVPEELKNVEKLQENPNNGDRRDKPSAEEV